MSSSVEAGFGRAIWNGAGLADGGEVSGPELSGVVLLLSADDVANGLGMDVLDDGWEIGWGAFVFLRKLSSEPFLGFFCAVSAFSFRSFALRHFGEFLWTLR